MPFFLLTWVYKYVKVHNNQQTGTQDTMRLTPKKDDAHLFVSKSNVFDTAASWEKLHPDHVTEIKFVSDVHRIISVHDRKNGQLHGYIRIRD